MQALSYCINGDVLYRAVNQSVQRAMHACVKLLHKWRCSLSRRYMTYFDIHFAISYGAALLILPSHKSGYMVHNYTKPLLVPQAILRHLFDLNHRRKFQTYKKILD